jgi:cyclase
MNRLPGSTLAQTAILAAALIATPTLAQEAAQAPEISFKSTEVSPGIFMVEGVGGFAGGNMAVLVGERYVAMIDDSMAPLAPALLAHVTDTAGRPINFMINTHVHGDHVGGNAHFAETGTVVFAHENIRKRLLPNPDSAGGAGGLPVVTFADGVTFHLDGIEARVVHVPAAHTDGDAFIHFPGANLIHAGDVVFHELFPFIDLDNGGTVDGFIAAQERILSLTNEETRIIPGHGQYTDRDGLEEDIAVLKGAQAKVRTLMEAGLSEEAILEANPLAEYESRSWPFITTERMTRTLIRDLAGDE